MARAPEAHVDEIGSEKAVIRKEKYEGLADSLSS